MGNAQPNTASPGSSTSASTATSTPNPSTTNGHTQPHHPSKQPQPPHPHHSPQQPAHPPYSLAYYSDALSRQPLTPSFFLASPPPSPRRPPSHPHSAPSFDLIAYADIARLLLSSSATLSLWRYKLVPARISEYLFWRKLFWQLDARHPDYQAYQAQAQQQHQQQQQRAAQQLTKHSAPGGGDYSQQTDASSAPAASTASSEREIHSLKAQIVSLQQHIASLTTQLHQSNHTIQHLQIQAQQAQPPQPAQPHHQPPTPVSSAPQPSSAHRGRWQPDKHTVEFFALDASLRDTLRAQKERRLGEVRREMRWIVDGDSVEDGPGRWECCGKEEWNAEGCKHSHQ